ncbi:MAG TPA: glycosyltransferase [Candidatus Acidoferrales bacterium]|nr:glycosyltransferase [Candidatus Acidoferrales bacterium]
MLRGREAMTPTEPAIAATNADVAPDHVEWVQTVRRRRPPPNMDEYVLGWERFFDHYAEQVDSWHRRNAGYHHALAALARFYVPAGARVLEVGSGNGDLLAALEPSRGVGVDVSGAMVRRAAARYPGLEFRQMPAERLDLGGEQFDYIVLSDLVGYLYDIRMVFERLRAACHAGTRVIMHWYSRLWQPLLDVAARTGLTYPQPLVNWTAPEDIAGLLHLSGFEIVQSRPHILLPKQIPGLSALANRYLAHLPGLRWFCLTNWVVARPLGLRAAQPAPRVSVICPCRNEAGNIESIARRLPSLGAHTELIFVEGHSNDDTLAECRRVAASLPDQDIKVFTQAGKGKGDAVRLGFSQASGDMLMILDADLSVAPEDLPHFYDALVSDCGEFVNGSRLVYAMDAKAMRFLNLLGNKFFARLLSGLLGQPVKDTLCGTKVLWRRDYERIADNRRYFGDFDPFGDFDLLFGAVKLNLRIVELPVRYRERTYGTTNISRFSHGWLLVRMCWFAAGKMLFVAGDGRASAR